MSRAADRLVDQIKQEIADGVLRPGDQLEESALAARFELSRTPVREAVRSLVDCGLLETRPRKGAFVRMHSAKELLDLFEVAAELEAMACRLAANVLIEDDADSIKSGLESCEKACQVGDVAAYGIANLDFHHAIHKACGNIWLMSQLKQIELRINPYRSMPYKERGRMEKSLNEHREICEAILAGDGESARTLMHAHLMLQGKRLPFIINAVEGQQRSV